MVFSGMDNNNDDVAIVAAAIVATGVIILVLINLNINYINRSKSKNEWKREKPLTFVSRFIDLFNEDTKYAINYRDYHLDIIKEFVLYGFRSGKSGLLVHSNYMLVGPNDANAILEHYSEMKKSDFRS